VPAKKGALPRAGSLLSLRPASLQLLALKRAANGKGFILRVQDRSGKAARPQLTWLGRKVPLGRVEGGRIACWRIERARAGWKATSTNVWEKESK